MQDTKEQQVTLPKISESVHSARVVKWLKKVGDSVKIDEALVEVSTAKVNSEIPSPFEGVIVSIGANETEEIQVGSELCTIGSQAIAEKKNDDLVKNTFLSPAVIKMASEHGLCIQSVQKLKGSGSNQRVTKQDVQKLIDEKNKDCRSSVGSVDRFDLVESLLNSHRNIPDASLILDLKMQSIVDWMKTKRDLFEKEHNVKVTYTAHILKALGSAIKEFKHLQTNGACNIGVAIQKGENLFVPVLENVDTLSLQQIAMYLKSMQNEPMNQPQNAKITFSNFGKSGVQIGLPIVPEGQNAILALGALEKRVIATDDDAIKIESRAWATLAFDHRAFDGMYAANFLQLLHQKIV